MAECPSAFFLHVLCTGVMISELSPISDRPLNAQAQRPELLPYKVVVIILRGEAFTGSPPSTPDKLEPSFQISSHLMITYLSTEEASSH